MLRRCKYDQIFDASCTTWEKDAETNLMFLLSVQRKANKLLMQNGYLYLSDVYNMIGINPGVYDANDIRSVGWIKTIKNIKDRMLVDFGIYDLHEVLNRRFVNGYERDVILHFNVQGDVLKKGGK